MSGSAQSAAKTTMRPRDAATLILCDRARGGLSVLMGKRHERHKFMPGKFVFPGGAVEPADRKMSVAGPLDEIVEQKLLARTRRSSPEYARGLALAAIRETFEDTACISDLSATRWERSTHLRVGGQPPTTISPRQRGESGDMIPIPPRSAPGTTKAGIYRL